MRLRSIGEFLTLLEVSASSLQLLDDGMWPFWVWLEEGEPPPLVWMVLTDTLLPFLGPFWLGEWGGDMWEAEVECWREFEAEFWRGGEGDDGKMGSGVQWAIISDIFDSQRFLEL